jgi:predicted nucleotidyltransferase
VNLADDDLALKPATVLTAIERIVAACQPASILAFGSRAKKNARIDSDLDLLVLLRAPVSDRRSVCCSLRERLADLPLSKDIFVTDPEHFAEHSARINSVYHDAAEDGLYLWRDGEWNLPAIEEVCRYRPEFV